MSERTKHLKVNSVDEIKGILNTINTEEYSLINYVWTEYGFYPTFFNELFIDFFKEAKGPRIAFCFPGQEIFYEQYVDILVTLEGFIDTTKAYKDSQETELLLNNFKTIIIENDFTDIKHKEFVDEQFKKKISKSIVIEALKKNVIRFPNQNTLNTKVKQI